MLFPSLAPCTEHTLLALKVSHSYHPPVTSNPPVAAFPSSRPFFPLASLWALLMAAFAFYGVFRFVQASGVLYLAPAPTVPCPEGRGELHGRWFAEAVMHDDGWIWLFPRGQSWHCWRLCYLLSFCFVEGMARGRRQSRLGLILRRVPRPWRVRACPPFPAWLGLAFGELPPTVGGREHPPRSPSSSLKHGADSA